MPGSSHTAGSHLCVTKRIRTLSGTISEQMMNLAQIDSVLQRQRSQPSAEPSRLSVNTRKLLE